MKEPILCARWVFDAAAIVLIVCGRLSLMAVQAKDRVEELRAIQVCVNDEMRSFVPSSTEANIFVDGPDAFRHYYVQLEDRGSGGLSR